MIMIVVALSLVAGSTQLSSVVAFMLGPDVGLRVSLGLALVALVMVAIAENARIPVDNPATHLELTMVHEAMVLEYSGRHLAMIELAASVKLLLYVSLIAAIFLPWGMARAGTGLEAYAIGGGGASSPTPPPGLPPPPSASRVPSHTRWPPPALRSRSPGRPISPSSPPPDSCSPSSRPRSPRCACSACRSSWARR